MILISILTLAGAFMMGFLGGYLYRARDQRKYGPYDSYHSDKTP
ncbi:hypothetical protein ACAW74_25800 [Fibrella sp. WM1]